MRRQLSVILSVLIVTTTLVAFGNCGVLGTSGSEPSQQPGGEVQPNPNSKGYFGYVGIDCGTNYLNEVASYTNLNHMCVYDASNIKPRLEDFKSKAVKAFLDLHVLFFQQGGPAGGSGIGYDLRPDYLQRWNQFVTNNRAALTAQHVGAFYIAEEPTWLGLTSADVSIVAQLVKAEFPSIPVAIIEAHQALDGLVVPTEVDWIGMDYYGAIDPNNTPAGTPFDWLNQQWIDYYVQLKAKKSRSDQKIILVFDAQYAQIYTDVGYTQASLSQFVQNYQKKMRADPDVVAMIGYVYFSGLDVGFTGLRDLPQAVKDANMQVGKSITNK